MSQERKLKKVVKNGLPFYYDESTGELVSEAQRIEIEEAKRKGKLAEIETDPLNRLQEQTKANYEKMGLSTEEADVAARGRR